MPVLRLRINTYPVRIDNPAFYSSTGFGLAKFKAGDWHPFYKHGAGPIPETNLIDTTTAKAWIQWVNNRIEDRFDPPGFEADPRFGPVRYWRLTTVDVDDLEQLHHTMDPRDAVSVAARAHCLEQVRATLENAEVAIACLHLMDL